MVWISEEVVLSGIRMCFVIYPHGSVFLLEMIWILPLTWETLVLCLAVWIAVKHFRELRGAPTGWTVGNCFTILIRSHAFYFARWAGNFNVIFLPCSSSTLAFLHFFAFTLSFFLHCSWYAIATISPICASDFHGHSIVLNLLCNWLLLRCF